MYLRSGMNGAYRSPGAGVPKAFVQALYAKSPNGPQKLAKSGVPAPMPEVMRQEHLRPVTVNPLRLEPPGGGQLAAGERLSLRAKFFTRKSEGALPEGLEPAAEKEAALLNLLAEHLCSARDIRAALAGGR